MPRIADRVLGDLPVRVHYPEGDGPFPVVVFSHGLGGSRLGYGYLGAHWAACGFVSVHPSHRESVALPVAPEELENTLGPERLTALRAMKEAIDDPENWSARPNDLSRLIDELPSLGEHVAALAGRIDPTRIAIAGHSYGAYAALLCAGASVELAGARRTFAEPRARAFLALSPPGNGSRGLHAASWAGLTRPVLCVTGTEDRGILGEPAQWRADGFAAMPPGEKWMVVLDGADHAAFAGPLPRRRVHPEHQRDIQEITTWFLRRQLLDARDPLPALHGADVRSR